jgi:hypothetical protein
LILKNGEKEKDKIKEKVVQMIVKLKKLMIKIRECISSA